MNDVKQRIQILRMPQVIARVGMKRSNIYLMLEDGSFPKPLKLGKRALGWVESEIDAWLEGLVAQRDKGAP